MQLIKCTAKLRKEMGLKNPASIETQDLPEDPLLGGWHANLLYINRRKCVIFVNDKTLYNFAVINLSRDKIKELDTIFVQHLLLNLFQEGFSEELVKQVAQEYDSIQFAKTDSKSVLGSMNNLAFYYKLYLQENGEHLLPSIVWKLNRMPIGAINYAFPIEKLKEIFGQGKN